MFVVVDLAAASFIAVVAGGGLGSVGGVDDGWRRRWGRGRLCGRGCGRSHRRHGRCRSCRYWCHDSIVEASLTTRSSNSAANVASLGLQSALCPKGLRMCSGSRAATPQCSWTGSGAAELHSQSEVPLT